MTIAIILILGRAAISNAQDCVIPPRDCTGTTAHCVQLVAFKPVTGTGYDNYPINGETATNQYRSYARRDLMMLVKHASAVVACKAKGWTPGNGLAIGLGDMSEKSGAIPGTSNGHPGHPKGTHVNGRDMDIAYYQLTSANNRLRAVCPHTSNNKDVKHCTGTPNNLDVRRTALFIGTLLTSDRVRVIGVDGRIEPVLVPEIKALCRAGLLPQLACNRLGKIASETSDTGKGWFRHHHHHLHVSLKKIGGRPAPADRIAPDNIAVTREINMLSREGILGHALTIQPEDEENNQDD